MMHQEAMMKQCRSDLNKIFHISKTPGEHAGAQISFKEELRVQIKKKVYMVSINNLAKAIPKTGPTGKNNGYFWVFKEYPQKSQIWESETNPNLGTWLGIP